MDLDRGRLPIVVGGHRRGGGSRGATAKIMDPGSQRVTGGGGSTRVPVFFFGQKMEGDVEKWNFGRRRWLFFFMRPHNAPK